jgi:hypothetical protein
MVRTALDVSRVCALNLRTGHQETHVGLTPEQAVVAAHAREHGDFCAWGYHARYGSQVKRLVVGPRNRAAVGIGDWVAYC